MAQSNTSDDAESVHSATLSDLVPENWEDNEEQTSESTDNNNFGKGRGRGGGSYVFGKGRGSGGPYIYGKGHGVNQFFDHGKGKGGHQKGNVPMMTQSNPELELALAELAEASAKANVLRLRHMHSRQTTSVQQMQQPMQTQQIPYSHGKGKGGNIQQRSLLLESTQSRGFKQSHDGTSSSNYVIPPGKKECSYGFNCKNFGSNTICSFWHTPEQMAHFKLMRTQQQQH